MPWLRWSCLLLGACAAVPVPAERPQVGEPAADATEQAIVDSLCAASTTTGMGRTVPAIPLDWLQAILAEGR